jgi:hypothetical protein
MHGTRCIERVKPPVLTRMVDGDVIAYETYMVHGKL